ncbi:hypothetical protein ACOMHN_047456 [Nucella lapillus]
MTVAIPQSGRLKDNTHDRCIPQSGRLKDNTHDRYRSSEMAPAAVAVVLVVTSLAGTSLSQTALNANQLHDDLVTLRPNVRPASDYSQPTEVNISFHLMSVISLDTVSQKLVSNGWMSVSWRNDYVTWDPRRYGGISHISPSASDMWRPRLSVLNSMKELKAVGDDYVVLDLASDGVVSWFPAERFETFCHIDVTFFPFDHQRCSWQLFGWAEYVHTVKLNPVMPEIDLDTYRVNGEWKLMGTRAWLTTQVGGPDSFYVLNYEVTLRRRPTLLALTVLLPVFVLSVTNVYVFTIPSEAGERLAYSMTSFLSFGVFMSFIVDLMPSSTETLSVMAVSMSCQLILSAVYVLLCILSLRLFHRDPHRHPVPPTLQSLIIYLEVLACLDPPSRSHNFLEKVEMISREDVFGVEVKGSRLNGYLDRWARKRQQQQELYSRPQDMTWQRVSRTTDKLLFRFFLSLVVVSDLAFMSVMMVQYFS